ncbi:MAG: MaoC family dehydratase [Bryobacterales bacterium]|nr:MaoC family dehydratase [Bryobacterales bacterium]
MSRIITSLDELQSLAGGKVAASSGWIAIEQGLIDSFASVSGDRQWIHVDAERARGESPWGTTIAHGFLTLSLLSRMASEAVSLQLGQRATINYGLNKVRFPAAVPVGSRLRGHFAVAGCGARPGGIEVVWRVTVEAEGQGKPVCVAEWVLLLVSTSTI